MTVFSHWTSEASQILECCNLCTTPCLDLSERKKLILDLDASLRELYDTYGPPLSTLGPSDSADALTGQQGGVGAGSLRWDARRPATPEALVPGADGASDAVPKALQTNSTQTEANRESEQALTVQP